MKDSIAKLYRKAVFDKQAPYEFANDVLALFGFVKEKPANSIIRIAHNDDGTHKIGLVIKDAKIVGLIDPDTVTPEALYAEERQYPGPCPRGPEGPEGPEGYRNT